MIYSSLRAVKPACQWPKLFQEAFAFLKNNDLEHMEPGKYPIDGEDVFADIQVQKTVKPSDKKAERHFEYIDIQYLITGEEIQGYRKLYDGEEFSGEVKTERDIVHYDEVDREQYITLRPGDFTVFFTNDIHKPNLTFGESRTNKKVVIKIREAAI